VLLDLRACVHHASRATRKLRSSNNKLHVITTITTSYLYSIKICKLYIMQGEDGRYVSLHLQFSPLTLFPLSPFFHLSTSPSPLSSFPLVLTISIFFPFYPQFHYASLLFVLILLSTFFHIPLISLIPLSLLISLSPSPPLFPPHP
jgi:hypothetical protein